MGYYNFLRFLWWIFSLFSDYFDAKVEAKNKIVVDSMWARVGDNRGFLLFNEKAISFLEVAVLHTVTSSHYDIPKMD